MDLINNFRAKLKNKLLLALLLVGLLPLGVSVLLSYQGMRETLLSQAYQSADSQIQLYVKHIELFMRDTEQVMVNISTIENVHHFFNLPAEEFDSYQRLSLSSDIPKLLSNYKFLPGLTDINMVRRDGTLLHFGAMTELGELDNLSRDFLFQVALQEGERANWIWYAQL